MGNDVQGENEAPGTRVVRWKQFGQDRLYVNAADGSRIGWLNLTNGVRVVEIEALRSEFERALAKYPTADDGDQALQPQEARSGEHSAQAKTSEPARRPKPNGGNQAQRGQEERPPPKAAGESAQTEYDRRAARDRQQRRATRKGRLAALLLFPFLGYGVVRLALAILEFAGGEVMSSVGGADRSRDPVISPDMAHTYGIYGAIAFAMLGFATFLSRKQTTEAFRVGAEGERKTGAILDRLPDGWHVIHDLPMPGGRGNIDHVVVGPGGLFTVETKNYASGVVIERGVVKSRGRDLTKVVDQAKRQVRVISELTGASVTPIVVVHGGGVTVNGWRQKPTVDGVRFCSGPRLEKALTGRASVLDEEAIGRIAHRLGPV